MPAQRARGEPPSPPATQPAKRRRRAPPAASSARRRQSQHAQGVVDPPSSVSARTPPSPPPEEDLQPRPAHATTPPSAQPAQPVYDSSPPQMQSPPPRSPPPPPPVTRSGRNSESLEREFDEPINWTLLWSLKLGSQTLYRDTQSVLNKTATAQWIEVREPLVRKNCNRKGVARFELNSFKVVAKNSRRGVRKVDYTRGDLDWHLLDEALRRWSLRYPAEQITAEVVLQYTSRDPPRATPRTSTTVSMLEDLSASKLPQSSQVAESPASSAAVSSYSISHAHLMNRWECPVNCTLSSQSEYCYIDRTNQHHHKIYAQVWRDWAEAISHGVATVNEPPESLKMRLITDDQQPKTTKGQQPFTFILNVDRQLLANSGASLADPVPVRSEIRSSPSRKEMSIDQALRSYIDWQKDEVQRLTWKEKLEEAFCLPDDQCMDLHTLKTKTPEWLVSQGIVQGIAGRLIRDIERWKRHRNMRIEEV
ncbi:Hypothetical protein D9617_52g060340 [Elsinoe fawcettii]|nr:Hypothetical protein D9617_52g060340 [Elsinoe fawcettii]